MVTMRRRNSEASLKASATPAVDFITQAPRTRAGHASAAEASNKRSRAVMEEARNNCAAGLEQEHQGLGTPVIRSSGLAPTSKSSGLADSPTVSADESNSTGTSESLGEDVVRVQKQQLPSSSNQSICCSESSEVCVSYDASGKEVVSCRRTVMTTATVTTAALMTTAHAHVGALPAMASDDSESEQEDNDDSENDNDNDNDAELLVDEFDPYAFIKTLPPLSKCVQPRNTFLLPRLTRHSHKKTLVLDLDETLVHSTLDGGSEHADFVFPVHLGSVTHMVSVRKRPHLHTFLSRMARHFEIVVFTASQQIYAEQLLDIVDPRGEYIRHRVYRDSCVVWEGNYLKDLTVLGRDLAHTIIVDNSPQAFGFQLENGVPIKSWYDDVEDVELLRLLPFLEELAGVEDVRPYLGDKYGLKDLVESRPYPAYY